MSKKYFVVLLAVAMLASVGCSRKKQQAYAPAPTATAIAPAPAVAAEAPAPVARRSSTYLK